MVESPKEEYNYACNECGKSFTAMEDLTRHRRQDHQESLQGS
jgi:uncharacterized Zn-finger protein